MCGICGFVGHITDTTRVNVERLIQITKKRGRDSLGFVHVIGDVLEKTITSPLSDLKYCSTMICTARAEPTTEFVCEKNEDNIPPFICSPYVVAHNGMIANDKQLCETFGIRPTSKIDTAIIPQLLHIMNGSFISTIEQLKGSMAFAMIDVKEKTFCLYRDYQPLWYELYQSVLYFASERDALPDKGRQFEVPPYSGFIVSSVKKVTELDIEYFSIDTRPQNERVFVICSGGLDSVTVATLAKQENKPTTLVHFLYNCRAQEREKIAVQKVADVLSTDLKLIDLSWLATIGGSNLTDTRKKINQSSNGAGAEICTEWVPARNTIMASLVAGLCDAENVHEIHLGLNLEESGAYPDNTIEYFKKLSDVFQVGTIARPKIVCPLGYYMKHEIVKLALAIHAPIEHAWSCYFGDDIHCGICGPCFMRRTAFKMNGIIDPIKYKTIPEKDFWKGCREI